MADQFHKLLVQNSKNLAQEAEIQCFLLPLQPLKSPPSNLPLGSMRLRPSGMLSTSGPSAQCPSTNFEVQTQKFLETVLEPGIKSSLAEGYETGTQQSLDLV